ncbi:MAG TPA: DUF4011 domain-containing protein [Thermoanaerobaculia bacterium]|nr:DUF4011 domain-containing protein [Thermoanaerobaculia bacterium]
MASEVTSPETPSAARRIAASLENWRRKLLDLSKRNRALSFKVYRVSTVAIVDEQPAEVFRQLYLLEKAMRFKPAAAAAAATMAEKPEEPEVVEAGPSFDFVPYSAGELAARHTDDQLQTTASPEQLDKSLRRLDEQARATLEEQGVNALFLALGMLHYKESPGDEETFRAPLVLLPVALSRRSAQAGYTVRAADEDPIVNPALAEHLRRDHGITLPELPDLTDIPAEYDLQTFLTATVAVLSDLPAQAGWAVKNDIYLGLFSFQKFVMYKDLEANGAAFAGHPLVSQLVTRSGSAAYGLPANVRNLDLDRSFSPEGTCQVVDADSSQLRAMAAVAQGHDLVLEGPPGTGKSQTITNLIAQTLAAGKSVLFVSEKMAALQVVYSRLVGAGLGELCLELHSTKANKRTVLQKIKDALDASLQRPRVSAAAKARLPNVRRELAAYVEALHEPHGELGLSPYQAYGELGAVREAPRLRYGGPVEGVSPERLAATERGLSDLARAAAAIGDPRVHPFRDSTRTFYSEDDLDQLGSLLADLRARLTEVSALAAEAEASFHLPPVVRLGDAETAAAVASVLERSPGAPLGVLASELWNAPPPQALALVALGREVQRLAHRVAERFTKDVLSQQHAEDIGYVETKEASALRFLRFLDGRYRAIRRRWTAWRRPGYSPSLAEQAAEMKNVDALLRERHALAAEDAAARQLFGGLWQGEPSDWDVLDGYIRWVVEFRSLCVAHRLREPAIALATQPRPDLSRVGALRAAAAAAASRLGELGALLGWPEGYLAAEPLAAIAERAASLAGSLDLAPRWAAFALSRSQAAAGLAGELLPKAMAGEVAFTDLGRAFRRAFLQQWLTAVVTAREPLRDFHALTHEERIAEFERLDEKVLQENRATLVARQRDELQRRLQTPEVQAALPFLKREMARQRAHAPLRKTLRQAGAAIRAIKPCFMMSPLTVAQLLEGDAPSFDLVVFDEASQLPAEDAVGAIARGRQLVVVGDPKQLPPTNFFAVMGGQVNAPVGEDGTPLFEDSESILEDFLGAGVPSTRLKWHYRSTHESLITFSNVSFYDADLQTFPSVDTDNLRGLEFESVDDGVYEGKGVNPVEARRVADAVVRHARECPELSLGVGTFSLPQQLAIQDEIERRRRQDPRLEPFFARREEEGFFVKNLENIQGDERDVIFLSVTYGRDREGKLRHNFGPINRENGWRRLNVLTTRAKRSMRVFASMHGDEIRAVDTTSRGARLLHDFLLYAEHGRIERPIPASGSGEAGVASAPPFERQVQDELERAGIELRLNIGSSQHPVDFGILDAELPGRFFCGVECDGPHYRHAETVRDRDRLRRQVLEARGWTLHRVWSTDWFKDRPGQIERLLGLISATRQRAREEAAAEEEARAEAERATAEAQSQSEPAVASPAEPPPAPSSPMAVRVPSHVGSRIPFDRLPPEEIRAAVLLVLRAGGLERKELINQVRTLFGFHRTGSKLQAAIGAVVDTLLADGTLGEGSSGVRLREELKQGE